MNQKRTYWLAACIAILAALLILWINLAVGIIGEPGHPANLMYVAVPVIGATGAVIVRFRPIGMVRVLIVLASLQALVGIITLAAGLGYPPTPPLSYLVLNVLLIALWSGSGWLFRRAATA